MEKLRLKVVEGNAAGEVIVVETELVIGRQAEGDGALASDVEISRQHARISAETGGRFGIEDLGSTNGTYVNGRRLEGRVTLETGDRITLGASALVVQVGSLQPTPTTSGTIAPAPGAGPPATDAPPPWSEEAPPPLSEEAPPPLSGGPPLTEEEAPPPLSGGPPLTEEAPLPAPGAAPGQSEPAPASFALRIEVDPGAGQATVSLDDSSDEVRLVYEDGRWRIA